MIFPVDIYQIARNPINAPAVRIYHRLDSLKGVREHDIIGIEPEEPFASSLCEALVERITLALIGVHIRILNNDFEIISQSLCA